MWFRVRVTCCPATLATNPPSIPASTTPSAPPTPDTSILTSNVTTIRASSGKKLRLESVKATVTFVTTRVRGSDTATLAAGRAPCCINTVDVFADRSIVKLPSAFKVDNPSKTEPA